MPRDMQLTGVERAFDADDIIVSKTDLKGRITYANQTFLKLSGYKERDVLGQPHSLIRHPQMPRCIFKMLWSTIASGKEIFAYVVNRSSNGDHYWVYAHVTPNRAADGTITGYHSNRRVPDRQIVEQEIIPLYDKLLEEEARHDNRKVGMNASFQIVADLLAGKGLEYDEFVATIGQGRRRGYR